MSTNSASAPSQRRSPSPSVYTIHLPAGLVLPYLILIRIINALTINTFFQADEYWQSLEPAHKLVYGYGYLTWEWREGLRSILHPLIFASTYYLNELIGLGDLGVVLLPKIAQGLIAAIGEWYLYQFVYRVTKNEVISRGALLLSVVSAFNWYCITRTFSNSLELTLTTMALAYWPWELNVPWNGLKKSLLWAAVSCIVRPTNGLIWVFVGVSFLFKHHWPQNLKFAWFSFVIGSVVVGANALLDRWYYGQWSMPILKFMKFNVTSSLSKFYGVAPWHFHITQSLPIILMLYTPFFLYGCTKYSFHNMKSLLIFVIGSFSCIDHKEFRFIYPLQPILLLVTAYGFYHWNLHHPHSLKYISTGIILINTLISLFFTQIHEKGVIDVIDYLRSDPDVQSIGFLTPCHSTPWQSYIHNPDIETWFLTCEPPLHLLGQENATSLVETYMDESDIFYEDPKQFLFDNFPPPFNKNLRTPGKEYLHEWPTHLVFFEDLEPVMKEHLADSPYQECARFWNSYFHWDSRRSGDVIVYCKWPWE